MLRGEDKQEKETKESRGLNEEERMSRVTTERKRKGEKRRETTKKGQWWDIHLLTYLLA